MEKSGRGDPFASTAENGEKPREFKGIRLRKWGKWVSEVRMPKTRAKIWLGSYDTAEQAARAFDAAVYCLRGPNANFNFPDSIPAIPSASSLSRNQIQVVAAKYAHGQIPYNSNLNKKNVLTEKIESPSRSSSASELEPSIDSKVVFEEQYSLLWEPLFGDSNCNQWLNLDNLPLLDEPTTWDLMSPTEEQGSFVFDLTDLWTF